MAPKVPNALLARSIPSDLATCADARRILGSPGFRVDELSRVICRDPTLVIDILKVANSAQGNSGQSLVTSIPKAITSLGVKGLTEIVAGAAERPNEVTGAVLELIPPFRERSQRRAQAASAIAQVVDQKLMEDAATGALFLPIGDMLAAMHLGTTFIQLVAAYPRRAQLLYRLSADHGIDVDAITPSYLERQGVPKTIWSRLSWEGDSLSPEGAVVRTICFSANELVEAYESGRIDSYSPDKKLPSKSSIRLLGIDERTYERIYEAVVEALSPKQKESDDAALDQLEIAKPEVPTISVEPTTAEAEAPLSDPAISPETVTSDTHIEESVIIVEGAPPLPPVSFPARQAVEDRVAQFGGLIESLADDIENTEELLASVLDVLVNDGPFKRAAILVPSNTPRKAFAVASRGLDDNSPRLLDLSGALGENFGALSKVQSVRAGPAGTGLGNGPYALAPLDVKHDQPVVLYADCGSHETLGFEARRAFRKVVDILNGLLPTLPGGIPIENSEKSDT